MSSGFSYTGSRPRCFDFWQEFRKCYAGADFPEDCRAQADDYGECLTHKKEIAKAKKIQEVFAEKQSSQLKQQKESTGVSGSGILSLGLVSPVDRGDVSKNQPSS
ncbi:NADH dehydrogenase Fe-S protein 5 [Phakopsora pachyrhizi]|uniref:NADH dehydrogenase [ubiquinone] iron-sulfur protein 5 n=1 Tax=Phakopsora pachyrhizi TaxID=170000 RepID=A0AAV0AZT2_PHAPC|nr:NADH dehydrogenase Fe-S protein 5 [Phakopsora pachyrhizi]KAI8450004.1 NADH dehydrogenase Fe-S protein 5 [Phakopsora pachyrhizi]CAH7676177.1 NADH dehydrogenase Fe-S protein 5 [Phakopsora pachyrhizi]CAH7688552.1 NADH dehydrogenase Fe-S protein 5 [Phakopsora pachyrhizi]